MTLRADGMVCGFVRRENLDPLLLSAAIDEGCEFQVIERLTYIECNSDHVIIEFDGLRIIAGHLIAADGANSQVRRMLNPALDFRRGFAVEGMVPNNRISGSTIMEFCFAVADHGYGWLFPKRDHVNVGLYTCADSASISKKQLRAFVLDKLNCDQVDHITGYPLGFGGESYTSKHQRVLFAGDAAGMAEVFLGEGLHNAVKSGELAAQAVATAIKNHTDAGHVYDSLLHDIRRDLSMSKFLALRLFYPRLDSLGLMMFRVPFVQSALMRGYAAGRTLPSIAKDIFSRRVHEPTFPTRAS